MSQNIKQNLLPIDRLIEQVKAYNPSFDESSTLKAFRFAKKYHKGQKRHSGEDYIHHPVEVAFILADLKMDTASIITALLHDTVEDTELSLETIKNEFDETISSLVDGVTKISKITFKNLHHRQGENIRKMIMAMGKDVRAIIVKLADRLHNMRTLNFAPYHKQLRIAQDTLDIYAPLAGRLGMHSIKVELEELGFRYAHPNVYYQLAQKIAKKKKERQAYIKKVIEQIENNLKKYIKFNIEITGRSKDFYSIYKKIKNQNLNYEQIHDLIAFRIIVNTVPQCYEILGLIHSFWKPVPGRFKDFIAMPKANNYQSLHTSLVGPDAETIEIQIRTKAMHSIAEKGIAAHWSYKENQIQFDNKAIEKYNWLRDMITSYQQTDDSDELLEVFKDDLFDGEIFVLTPNGEVKELPEGATPIDFAFSVHTDLGFHIMAARVNGKMMPIKQKLKTGDRVEIITSKNQRPSKDWLNFCVTGKAKTKIRSHIKGTQKEMALSLGKNILEKSLRKYKIPFSNIKDLEKSSNYKDLFKQYGCKTLNDLYMRIGYGHITPQHLSEQLAKYLKVKEIKPKPTFFEKIFKSATKKKKKESSLVQIDGLDNIMVTFAKCCLPIPGDPISGFITRGRGIVIHTSNCPKGYEFDKARQVDVEWNASTSHITRLVSIRVTCFNKTGLLKDMTEVFSNIGMNIQNVKTHSLKDEKSICVFDVFVRDTEHLSEALLNLEKLDHVLTVTRVKRS